MEEYKGKVQQKDVQHFLEDHLARAILFQPTKKNFCYQIPFYDAHRHLIEGDIAYAKAEYADMLYEIVEDPTVVNIETEDWEVTPLTRHANVFFHADLFYFCDRTEEAIDEIEKLRKFLDNHPKLYKSKDREAIYKEINESFALYSEKLKTDIVNEIKRSSGDALLCEAKTIVHHDRANYPLALDKLTDAIISYTNDLPDSFELHDALADVYFTMAMVNDAADDLKSFISNVNQAIRHYEQCMTAEEDKYLTLAFKLRCYEGIRLHCTVFEAESQQAWESSMRYFRRTTVGKTVTTLQGTALRYVLAEYAYKWLLREDYVDAALRCNDAFEYQYAMMSEEEQGIFREGYATHLHSLGQVYLDMGGRKKALLCFERSLEAYKMVARPEAPEDEETIDNHQGKVYHDLIECYIDYEDFEMAEEYCYEAQHFFYDSKFDMRFDLAVVHTHLAYIKCEQRKWRDAMNYGHSGESLCESLLNDCVSSDSTESFLNLFIAVFDYYLLAVTEGGFECEEGLTMDYAIDIILKYTEGDSSRLEKSFFAGIRKDELNKQRMTEIWKAHMEAMCNDFHDDDFTDEEE
jgi:tetratricopeptide (TPR) repeat protein